MADDRELASELATHRYDHAERVDDCPVCREVMRHVDTWFRGVLARTTDTKPERWRVRAPCGCGWCCATTDPAKRGTGHASCRR